MIDTPPLNRYKVTYTNNGIDCTLSHTTKVLFADTKTQVMLLCELLYSTGDNFIISKIKQEVRL